MSKKNNFRKNFGTIAYNGIDGADAVAAAKATLDALVAKQTNLNTTRDAYGDELGKIINNQDNCTKNADGTYTCMINNVGVNYTIAALDAEGQRVTFLRTYLDNTYGTWAVLRSPATIVGSVANAQKAYDDAVAAASAATSSSTTNTTPSTNSGATSMPAATLPASTDTTTTNFTAAQVQAQVQDAFKNNANCPDCGTVAGSVMIKPDAIKNTSIAVPVSIRKKVTVYGLIALAGIGIYALLKD